MTKLFRTRAIGCALAALAVLTIASVSRAQEGPHWKGNLEEAKQEAASSNRLVLVHFWAPWCGPCRALEGNVFERQGVARMIEMHYVPVKVNADEFKATAQLYGIQRIPTDVILTPAGKVLAKLSCPPDAGQYLAQLDNVYKNPPGGVANPNLQLAQAPAAPVPPLNNQLRPQPAGPPQPMGPPPTGTAYGAPAVAGPGPVGPGPNAPGPTGPPPAVVGPAIRGPMDGPPNAQVVMAPVPGQGPPVTPAGFRPAVNAVPQRPPIGLDGFCPVTMVERSKSAPQDPRCWAPGDTRWGAVHRGVTYLFAGPDQQRRFLAAPDRYAPVLSGNDPVLAFDRGVTQPGRRDFGTFYEDRIYLFAGNDTLDRFRQDPHRYAEEVRQAESAGRSAMR